MTDNSIKHASSFILVLVSLAWLSGCQTLNQASQQMIGTDATQALTRSMSSMAYKGQVWNMPYELWRAPDSSYYLRKIPGGRMNRVGRFLSLKKVYSHQSRTYAMDVFATPTDNCPGRYLVVVASGNAQGHFTMLGCGERLSFQAGSDHYIYATQEGTAGTEPLAYRLGANRETGPFPISTLAGYPQRALPHQASAVTHHGTGGRIENRYAGHVWNADYVISKAWDGEYVIRKRNGHHVSRMGRFLFLKKIYSTQTRTFAVDVFAAPTRNCPHHYLMVFGSGNARAQFKTIGCTLPLTFQAGTDGYVYATQARVDGATALAYRIGEHRMLPPQPITQLAGYPQRTAHHRHARHVTTSDDGLGPVPIPEQAPNPRSSARTTSQSAPAPVTVDLGGGSSR